MAEDERYDVGVYSIPMNGPGDTSGLASLIDEGQFAASDIVAILGKTEGNGLVNDFTRGYSTFAFAHYLSGELAVSVEEIEERVAFVMSGGTEGVLSPHATVFTVRQAQSAPPGEKRLAVRVAFTRDFRPEEIGRDVMAFETAAAVREAMASADIEDPGDVHFVQIKCPLLTSGRVAAARRRGHEVATDDAYASMGYSRGASALGVAIALGEVPKDRIADEAILEDWDLYSTIASTSAGIELLRNVIILMGNSSSSASPYVIGHDAMEDAIDGEGVRRALRAVGITADGSVSEENAGRIVNVFAKAESDPSGEVRGRRHTMLTDSDVHSTRHARAVVGAVIASITGDPMVYVSGGSEHQGPPGGGPVAVIARAD